MNFLVDAQLPRRLVRRLQDSGHDALHTLDLPDGNRTTDAEINRLSIKQERIVITKDADFVNALLITGTPYKLLLISTGNIANPALEALLARHLSAIASAFESHNYIELTRTALIVHG